MEYQDGTPGAGSRAGSPSGDRDGDERPRAARRAERAQPEKQAERSSERQREGQPTGQPANPPPSQPGAEPLRLRVAEAASRDVGRAVARLDPDDLRRLGVAIGDLVLVTGTKATACRAMPAFKEQRGKGLVHLDGLSRDNAGAGLDDSVALAKAAWREAQTVTLTPVNVSPSERDLQFIGSRLDGVPVLAGDRVRAALFGGRSAEFNVERTTPAGPVLIGPGTRLLITRGAADGARGAGSGGGAASSGDGSGGAARRLSYEDVGGLRPQVARIREMIELPLRFPEVFERLGIDPPKGVLLHGPPGCGKTLIARTIAQETRANFFSVSGPEVIHKFYGESEAHLRKIWEEAARRGPSIIFLDEVDSIAPKRSTTQGEVEKRVVAQLLALMDGMTRRSNVIVIAATNLPNNIDPALRRPGRFDREISIPVPDRHGRRQILDIHSRGMPLNADVDLDRLADMAHGYVGADVEALCREAAMACLRTVMRDIDFAGASIPYETLSRLEVRMEHFLRAFGEVEPSAVREVFVEVPNVAWSDIGGLHETKARLVEALEWPLKHADLFERARVRPPKGILLAGPPGVGKTMLARAAATQCQANFISVKGPELMGRFVGESESALREVFRKARQASPCVIFFDEIDALLPRRGAGGADSGVPERVLGQFLAEMDGVEDLRGVLVLGATNRLDVMDPAALRPGRFDHIIELGAPDEEARAEIFRVHLTGRPLAPGLRLPALCNDLAARTPGASGAQIAGACQRAALRAVARAVQAREGGGDDVSSAPVVTADDLSECVRELLDRAT